MTVANGYILMRFPDDISCFLAVVRFPNDKSCLLALVRFAWFCVCKLGGSLVGRMNVGWVVVGESASALGDRRVCVEVV